MHTFNPNTRARSQQVNENFTELSNGIGDVDNNRLQLFRAETCFDFVQSGLIWTLVSGLNGTMTAGVAYIADGSNLMQRITPAQIASRAFTASKDTYVDLGSDGTIYYNEVANGATAPSLSSNRMRIAVVVTSGSAITAIFQTEQRAANTTTTDRGWCGLDNIGNPVRNTSPYEMTFRVARHNGTVTRSSISGSGQLPNMLQKYRSSRTKEKITISAGVMYINNAAGGNYVHQVVINGVQQNPQNYVDKPTDTRWTTEHWSVLPYYIPANTSVDLALNYSHGAGATYTNNSNDQTYMMPTLIIEVKKDA